MIEIEGKKYVTYEEYRKSKVRTAVQFGFLILLFIAILALVLTIITIVKYQDLVFENPVNYVMDRYDYLSCSCMDRDGNVINSQGNNVALAFDT